MTETVVTIHNNTDFVRDLLRSTTHLRVVENENVFVKAHYLPLGKYELVAATEGTTPALTLLNSTTQELTIFPTEGVWETHNQLLKVKTANGTYHFIINPLW